MKIAVLGDLHLGRRLPPLAIDFHEYDKKFWNEVFFPELEKQGIDTIVQTGDLFDHKKFINFHSLHLAKQDFFYEITRRGLIFHTYPGNHDMPFKDSMHVNAIDLLLSEFMMNGNVVAWQTPGTMDLWDVNVDFIPWICKDNEDQIKEFIAASKSPICFGHFQILGFEMDQGHVCTDGMRREDLIKYDMVISGHHHHRSSDGHIFYVGTPSEQTWADYGDTRGFHILDTKTRVMEFHKNPFHMFHKICYDDSTETLDSIVKKDFSEFTGTFVKVIVQCKSNPFLFDTFMAGLTKAQPLDISIVENVDVGSFIDANSITQADTTPVIIDKYIDGMDMNLNKDSLKGVMREIYHDAENSDSTGLPPG